MGVSITTAIIPHPTNSAMDDIETISAAATVTCVVDVLV